MTVKTSAKIGDKRKDNKLIEESATIFPILASNGDIKNFVAVKRDVTERNKLENQIRQMQKLDAIGTLASGIAHDFNNILGAIFGYTQLAKKRLPNTPENKVIDDYLDKIFSASSRAKDLIDQILMFSRNCDYDPTDIDLRALVKESIKFLRATIPASISILQRIDLEPRKINGDVTQIQQVILNLCANAAHAMEEKGGTLEIGLTNHQIDLNEAEAVNLEPGSYSLLSISDTGKGIKEEVIQRIFEPFFTTKEKGKGIGLGLSVVHGIVSKHGGAITVRSEEGVGTQFRVYLPSLKDAAAEPGSDLAFEIPAGSESILFVDDESDLCDVYGSMLKLQGFQVHSTTRGRDALDQIIENPGKFDLIITDYTMPEMNGIELSKSILKYEKIPVILISGLGELIPETELESTGIVARFSKPIEYGTFIRGIKDILIQDH